MASELKEQLEAVRREASNWPAWRRMEIEAEVAKTPLRREPGGKNQSSRKPKGAGGTSEASNQ
jgi:hypothetical protein